MIARMWSGRTCKSDSEEYLKYILETGAHDCSGTDGNRGVFVLRRDERDEAEFLFLSLWDTFDSIRRFSGPDESKAIYYPEDRRFLCRLDPTVSHFEVAYSALDSGAEGKAEEDPSIPSWWQYLVALR